LGLCFDFGCAALFCIVVAVAVAVAAVVVICLASKSLFNLSHHSFSLSLSFCGELRIDLRLQHENLRVEEKTHSRKSSMLFA